MLCLIVFIGYLFYQESSKLGRSKKSGGKNGPADDEDVSIFFTFHCTETWIAYFDNT